MTKPKRTKPVKAWALVTDSGGFWPLEDSPAPMMFWSKADAQWHHDTYNAYDHRASYVLYRPVRVIISVVKK